MLDIERILWQVRFGRVYVIVIRKVTKSTNCIMFYTHWFTLAGGIPENVSVKTANFCDHIILYRHWLCESKRKVSNYISHEYILLGRGESLPGVLICI